MPGGCWSRSSGWWSPCSPSSRCRRPRPRRLARLWPLLTCPALAVGLGVLTGSGLVERITFAAHRTALDGLVAEVAAAPGQRVADRRVGLYSVLVARSSGDCTTVTLRDTGFLNTTGYAYCVVAPPVGEAAGAETTYEPRGGAWFAFTDVW